VPAHDPLRSGRIRGACDAGGAPKKSTLLLIGWLCCRSRSRSLQLSSPAVVTAPE